MRKSLTTKQRVAIFQAADGVCDICQGCIQVGERWEVSHRIPLALGGKDESGNMYPAHAKCHRAHTSDVDVPAIAQAKRREAQHLGARQSRNPLPGGRNSKWRKKLDGSVVPR